MDFLFTRFLGSFAVDDCESHTSYSRPSSVLARLSRDFLSDLPICWYDDGVTGWSFNRL